MSRLRRLWSDQLLEALHRLVGRGRAREAELLEHIGEMDARRLYLREGCPSMFSYCVDVLHFSEAAAFQRVGAARAARKFPELLNALRSGELHVTGMRLLAPHLVIENTSELLTLARNKTGKEIQALLADRNPRPSVVAWIRRKPAPSHGAEDPAPTQRSATSPIFDFHHQPVRPPAACAPQTDSVRPDALAQSDAQMPSSSPLPRGPERSTLLADPLGGNRYYVRFTATPEMYNQLRELQDLMRHQIPDGDLTQILARALATLLAQVRKQKFGECSNPRKITSGEDQAENPDGSEAEPSPTPSRQIPAAIRRAVSKRDEGSCTYVSPTGRRCGSRTFLEFHHLVPWAVHPKHDVDGITLRCRAHNLYEAERDFGEEHMAQFKKPSGSLPSPEQKHDKRRDP